MTEKLAAALTALTREIALNENYDIGDELFYQVLGHVLFGYAVAQGRSVCYMDMVDIKDTLVKVLVALGPAEKYTKGMIDSAQRIFVQEKNHPLLQQLIEIGYSNAISADNREIARLLFVNFESIRKAMPSEE